MWELLKSYLPPAFARTPMGIAVNIVCKFWEAVAQHIPGVHRQMKIF